MNRFFEETAGRLPFVGSLKAKLETAKNYFEANDGKANVGRVQREGARMIASALDRYAADKMVYADATKVIQERLRSDFYTSFEKDEGLQTELKRRRTEFKTASRDALEGYRESASKLSFGEANALIEVLRDRGLHDLGDEIFKKTAKAREPWKQSPVWNESEMAQKDFEANGAGSYLYQGKNQTGQAAYMSQSLTPVLEEMFFDSPEIHLELRRDLRTAVDQAGMELKLERSKAKAGVA